MSTLKVNTIQNTSGGSSSTPEQIEQGRAKAWVLFNGTNGAILSSFNVSSITRHSLGQYTVNFTNSFSNTNYCAIPAVIFSSVGNDQSGIMGNGSVGGRQTGSCRFYVVQGTAQFDATVGVSFIG
tara:strand:+ start:360 stop:734 length:375 start_codon:yes stop_codon:yes gene_type:complete